MHNNEILRRLSDALSLTDARLLAIFALGGDDLAEQDVRALTREQGKDGAVVCPDDLLARFLDGLIVEQRGPREPGRPTPVSAVRLTNNAVLKKLRIALALKEDDVLRVLAAGGNPISNRELTTLFRKPGNKHFRKCGDDVLRSFLIGLEDGLGEQLP
ncbi:MAG: DUF1456 family protein [Deltaproteobacteria bacterium]|nr:DUF1456 family protein [Deltaproteobacteria bacterium]